MQDLTKAENLLTRANAYGVSQTADGTRRKETLDRITQTIDYMTGQQVAVLPEEIRKNCQVCLAAALLRFIFCCSY